VNGKSILRMGGTCSVLVGVSYLVAGLTYLLLPQAQRGGTLLHDTGRFMMSLAQGGTFITIQHVAEGLGGLIGIGLVLAVIEITSPLESGWTRLLNVMAGFGFAVTALDNLRISVVEPLRAAAYVTGDPATRAAVVATKCFVSVDPVMWLSFGLVGSWVFFVSYLGMRRLRFPRLLGVVGMATGVFYFFIEAGTLLKNELVIAITAGVGALVLGPVWYIWLGRILRNRAASSPSGR
jgi:hypothetical protein